MEEWRSVKGYEGYYEVSSKGKVRSVDRVIKTANGIKRKYSGKILSQHLSDKNYPLISLYMNCNEKTYYVHKLVAISFLGHKPCGSKEEVDHINGDRTDNSISNLRILSGEEHRKIKKHSIWGVSKYKYACWHKKNKKWLGSFSKNGKSYHVGYYESDKEASLAVIEYRKINKI